MKILKSKKFLVFLLALFILQELQRLMLWRNKGNIIAHIKMRFLLTQNIFLNLQKKKWIELELKNLRKLKTI